MRAPIIGSLLGQSFAVVHVQSAAQALDAARRLRPDTLVLGSDLPDMSGLDACRMLRDDPEIERHVPILVLAAERPSPDQRVSALRAGAWDYTVAPGNLSELGLKLQAYVQAKVNLDAALAGGLLDPATGLLTRPGLARRTRELGALMARDRHGAMACIVLDLEAGPIQGMLGGMVTRAARISDVVGILGPRELAVVAPGTDHDGAIRLAHRFAELLGASNGKARRDDAPMFQAGYDAAVNLRYTPLDPATLLAHAADAVRRGRPVPHAPWLRRYEPAATTEAAEPAGASSGPLRVGSSPP